MVVSFTRGKKRWREGTLTRAVLGRLANMVRACNCLWLNSCRNGRPAADPCRRPACPARLRAGLRRRRAGLAPVDRWGPRRGGARHANDRVPKRTRPWAPKAARRRPSRPAGRPATADRSLRRRRRVDRPTGGASRVDPGRARPGRSAAGTACRARTHTRRPPGDRQDRPNTDGTDRWRRPETPPTARTSHCCSRPRLEPVVQQTQFKHVHFPIVSDDVIVLARGRAIWLSTRLPAFLLFCDKLLSEFSVTFICFHRFPTAYCWYVIENAIVSLLVG